jgi:hypothetical protein
MECLLGVRLTGKYRNHQKSQDTDPSTLITTEREASLPGRQGRALQRRWCMKQGSEG